MSIEGAVWAGNAINAANFYELCQLNQRAEAQHETLQAMLSAQQRAEALQQHRERLQQVLFAADQLLQEIAACPEEDWDATVAAHYVRLRAGLQRAGLTPEAFADLSYKQLAVEVARRFAALSTAIAQTPSLKPLIARAQAGLDAEEAALAAERARQEAQAAEARRRAAYLQQLASEHKTALIVTLISLGCFPLLLPVGFYLAYRVRSRAKRECPEAVGSVSLAFYIGGGVLALGVVVLALGLATHIGR
jgi:hypothetical protein